VAGALEEGGGDGGVDAAGHGDEGLHGGWYGGVEAWGLEERTRRGSWVLSLEVGGAGVRVLAVSGVGGRQGMLLR
jgi:hypothetical protein